MNNEVVLIERINKNNDNASFKELLNEYTKMIQSIVNSFDVDCGNYRVNREDMFQEGTIGLLDACRTYRTCFDTKFSTYAYTIIKRKVQRFYYDTIDKYNEERYSLDNLEVYDHCSFVVYNKEIRYEDCIRNREKLEEIIKDLSEQDKAIIRMRIDSYSYDEIARSLNIKRKRIDNRLYRIKRKFNSDK